jgi:hypothetical protein
MADTITNTVLQNTKRYLVVQSQIVSDGTGSTDVVLVDKSAYTGPDGTEPAKLVIEKIEYTADGMQVQLEFEHTADDLIANLAGHGCMDFAQGGKFQGFVDPASAGGTGDIVATTVGHTAGDKATVTLYMRKKD